MAAEPTLFLIHGAESFLVGEEGRRLVDGWKKGLVSDFGFDVLEPSGLSASRLREALLQGPFLDPYRVVVVRWVAPARADGLAGAFDLMPDSTRCVITVNGKLGASSKLVKAVGAAGGRVVEMAPLKGRRLGDWAADRARALGLNPALSAQVVRVSPPDLGIIDSELRKLAAYQAGGGRLDPATVTQLLVGGKEDEIFRLTDLLLPRPRAEAWAVARGLMDQGLGATSIAYRLARHVALVLEVKTRTDRGERLSDLQSGMREHPFVIEKAMDAGRRTSPDRLEAQLQQILTFEWEVKSGQIDADLGLEGLLARL